jgi:hypothetical protein
MANAARTGMLINKRRFFKNTFIDSFGGRDSMKATRRIAVRTYRAMFGSALSNFLKSEVIKMAESKPEETLHNYLRRYFEKISKSMTNQCAEQREPSRMQVTPNTRSSAGDRS